jgi:hypothetical protein
MGRVLHTCSAQARNPVGQLGEATDAGRFGFARNRSRMKRLSRPSLPQPGRVYGRLWISLVLKTAQLRSSAALAYGAPLSTLDCGSN